MGEEKKERKKPSSLRTRVERTRKTYHKKKNPVPMIVGAVVLLLFLVGMFVFLPRSGSSTSRPGRSKRPRPADSDVGSTTSAPGQPVAREPQSVSDLVFYAGDKRRRLNDPEGALSMLKANLSKWGDAPEVHCEMAYAVDAIIAKTRSDPAALRRLKQEKLGHLKKAKALLDSGKRWSSDPLGNKTSNLDTSIEQAGASLGN